MVSNSEYENIYSRRIGRNKDDLNPIIICRLTWINGYVSFIQALRLNIIASPSARILLGRRAGAGMKSAMEEGGGNESSNSLVRIGKETQE